MSVLWSYTFAALLLLTAGTSPVSAQLETLITDHSAVFYGCRATRHGTRGFCSFVDQSTRLFVYSGGFTPDGLLTELGKITPGRRVALTGVRRTLYDGAAEVELSAISLLPMDRYDRLLGRLQGRWRSESDPLDVFSVTGAKRVNAYAGATTFEDYVLVQPECGVLKSSGPYLYAWDAESGTGLCYEIRQISDSRLEMVYQPRGTLLRYTREHDG